MLQGPFMNQLMKGLPVTATTAMSMTLPAVIRRMKFRYLPGLKRRRGNLFIRQMFIGIETGMLIFLKKVLPAG